MQFKAKNGVVIAAHRGNSKFLPENTLPAFQSAIELGADMLETDIHITKDGELVLMHDDDVKRMTGVSGRVYNMTFEEVRALRVGNPALNLQVPTLKEFLDLCAPVKGLLLDLEIKVYSDAEGYEIMTEAVDKTIALCNNYPLENRILFNCFDAAVLEYIYKNNGHRFLYHGYYPYREIMHNVTVEPEEYLDYACFWAGGEQAKQCCQTLLNQGVAPCSGSNTPEPVFFELAGYGCAMFTEDNPKSALEWRNKLKPKEL